MTADGGQAMLRLIRAAHSVVWLFFVLCIVGIPVAASLRRFTLTAWLIGIVMIEVLVLVVNRMRCPLTDVAARYTTDRRPNFDIWLPEWIARYNQRIFGWLFVAGVAFAYLQWRTAT